MSVSVPEALRQARCLSRWTWNQDLNFRNPGSRVRRVRLSSLGLRFPDLWPFRTSVYFVPACIVRLASLPRIVCMAYLLRVSLRAKARPHREHRKFFILECT